MADQTWIQKLEKLHACPSAIEWCETQPDYATAWKVCDRGDWMLWLVGRLSGSPKFKSRKKFVLASSAASVGAYTNDTLKSCAQTVRQFYPEPPGLGTWDE